MPLSKYASEALRVADELQELLFADEYAEYLEAIPETWADKLAFFQDKAGSWVERVAISPPAKRRGILQRHQPEIRFWLIAAAVLYARQAYRILAAADDYLQPAGSYRKMIERAVTARAEMELRAEDMWPFPIAFPDEYDE